MRKKLKSIDNQRMRFEATFERFGEKPAFRGPPITTLLFRDVRRLDTAELVTDHLWFTETKGFAELAPTPGAVVQFDARVSQYEKGYRGRRAEERGENWWEIDYRLSRPTKIVAMEE